MIKNILIAIIAVSMVSAYDKYPLTEKQTSEYLLDSCKFFSQLQHLAVSSKTRSVLEFFEEQYKKIQGLLKKPLEVSNLVHPLNSYLITHKVTKDDVADFFELKQLHNDSGSHETLEEFLKGKEDADEILEILTALLDEDIPNELNYDYQMFNELDKIMKDVQDSVELSHNKDFKDFEGMTVSDLEDVCDYQKSVFTEEVAELKFIKDYFELVVFKGLSFNKLDFEKTYKNVANMCK